MALSAGAKEGGGEEGQDVLVYSSVYSMKRNSSTQVIFSCITLFSIAGRMIDI